MITDFQSIVDEWSYRVGVIDLENYKHRYHLNQILYEYGCTQEVIDKINQNLTEDDIVQKKQSDGSYGSSYTVKKHNPDRGQKLVKKNASKDDIKRAEKGEEPEDENKPILNDTSVKRTYKEHTAEEVANIILQEVPEDYLLEITEQKFENFNNKLYVLLDKYNVTAADTKDVLLKIQESFTPQENEDDGTETDSTGSEAN